ncbi:MAG: hypothetical protein HQ502_01920 [Alphaproteobacteria bacterium]|nr:hypothetical protein [Alphaproteobacteria bacterium]
MTDPVSSRHCVICAAALPDGARYCTNCKKYQGWFTRFLGGLNVQALVTLVPIVTLAFVFVKDQFVVHGSDVRVTALSCERDAIRLAASNIGDRTAIIKSIRVGVASGSAAPNKTYPAQPLKNEDNPGKQLELQAQALKVYDLIVLNEQGQRFRLPTATAGAPNCAYRLAVQIVAFDHAPDPKAASCPCPVQ